MISPVIICGDKSEAAGRTRQGIAPAQPCATRDSAQINSKRGRATVSRNSAAYQPLRMRAGGSDDRALNRGGIVANVKFLPASFQSAQASRAVTAGVLSVISAPLRPFYLSRPFRLPGSLIRRSRVQDCRQTPRGCDASIILQGWQREPRDMLVSRWMALFRAHYTVFSARANEAYETERNHHDANSALVRLADFVAGKTTEKEEAK